MTSNYIEKTDRCQGYHLLSSPGTSWVPGTCRLDLQQWAGQGPRHEQFLLIKEGEGRVKSYYTKARTPGVPGDPCGRKSHRAAESFEGGEIRQAPREKAGRVKMLATEVLHTVRR